jgi:serine O-acetyltransferase
MLLKTLREDIKTVFAKDPAARSTIEVLLCYPGLHAIWGHRIAHFLWIHKIKLPARILSQINRFFTGVEIHPGAKIGRRFFIDHGMGIVIGETSEIGDDCLMYKGVVLGGTSFEHKKRHPTIGNHVVIGSNACILGSITIGANARIGSGSVVTQSVPAGVTVVGVPARAVTSKVKELEKSDLDHGNLPDPVADVVKMLLRIQGKIEKRLITLEKTQGIKSPRILNDYSEEKAQIQEIWDWHI